MTEPDLPQASDSTRKRRKRRRLRCPLCGGFKFSSYRGRQNARCVTCGAKERARLMALVLKRFKPRSNGLPVYHFAPEPAISLKLQERFGTCYQAADLMPELYSGIGVPVSRVDLTSPLDYIRTGSCGGLVHSHVLEHIPVSLDRMIHDLNAALAPGGFHLFQIPVHPGWYREDMDPTLAPSARTSHFHQDDHMRSFGIEDLQTRVLDLFKGFEQVDLKSLITSADLIRAAIPANALDSFTSHSVFLFIKAGRLPVWKPWLKKRLARLFGRLSRSQVTHSP